MLGRDKQGGEGPSAPLPPGRRLRGTVLSWGPKGYGFIYSPDLPRDAWCHVYFIVDRDIDVTRPLPVGLELEFEPRVVEGERIQAHQVTRPGVALPGAPGPKVVASTPRAAGPLASSIAAWMTANAKVRPEAPPASHLVLVPPLASTPLASVSPAGRLLAERARLGEEAAALQHEEEGLRRRAAELQARIPETIRELEVKLAEAAREHERQLALLRTNAEESLAAAEAVAAKRRALPSAAQNSLAFLAAELPRARASFAEGLGSQTKQGDQARKERAAAVARAGEPAVREYEESRRRQAAATDPMEKLAYEMVERSKRALFEAYARALDQKSATPQAVTLTLMVSQSENGRLDVAIPVAPDGLFEGDIGWRLAACLFDAAERVAREVDAEVTAGVVCGSLAVELRPWAVEPELFEVALREAWDERPTLASRLALATELLAEIDAPFEPTPLEDPPALEGVPLRDLRGLAQRLQLGLSDLIASLTAAGLPFRDDLVEEGVEETLREMLKGHVASESGPTPVAAHGEAASPPVKASAAMIASRMLTKLVRDRRFGSRHTNEDNVWGHHFADNEKAAARELVRRLKRIGILVAKAGGDSVALDPRRMDDVRRVIELRWTEPGLFEGLE